MSVIHFCGGPIFQGLRGLHNPGEEQHTYSFDQLRGIATIEPPSPLKEEDKKQVFPLLTPPPPPPPEGDNKDSSGDNTVETTATKRTSVRKQEEKQKKQQQEQQKSKKRQKLSTKTLDNIQTCGRCSLHCCTNCPTHCVQLPQPPPPPPLPIPLPPQQPIPLPIPPFPPQQPFPFPNPQQPLPFPFPPNPNPNPFPNPIPLPNPPPNQPMPGQRTINVKMPSAYYGDVVIECVDRGNGNYELIGNTVPVEGKSLVIKCIDAQRNGITEQNLPGLLQVAQMPPLILNVNEAQRQKEIIAALRSKPNKTAQEINMYKQALVYLNPVDAHFLTKEHMQFLYEFCGLTNVNTGNVNFLANVCNLPNVDNAFFTKYMVYGTGKRMFYPMCCIDVGSHELFHGVTDVINGLIYKGHSGAINEHISDAGSLFFERYMYKKFNENADKSDDILGQFDFDMGEDVGREMRILRSFENPEQSPQPQPSVYRGRYWADPNSPADYGGVHSNSGVGNRLLFLVVQSVGFEVSGKVFFASWKLLKPNSNYMHYRDALKTVAAQYGILPQMQQALNAVGLTDVAVSDWYGA